MLTYNMDERGDTPLYQYLYRRIRDDILSGVLSTGERLPSKRSLAEHLRVSVVTVEGAYGQLEAEGYVYTRPKRGVYVDWVEQRPPAVDAQGDGRAITDRNRVPSIGRALPQRAEIPPERAGTAQVHTGRTGEHAGGTGEHTGRTGEHEETASEHRLKLPERTDTVRGERPPAWRLDLGSNRTDPALFPASAWARLVRRTLSEEDLLEVPPHQGLERLRRAIAADLRSYRGIAADADQIVVGAGAEYLYILLAQLLGPSAVIALEDPGYPKIRMVYQKCGAVCVNVPMDRQGIGIEALARSGAAAAHISPAHHYPTGVVTPIGRRHALLRWAAEGKNRWIIEDDYDSEFRSAGRPLPAMASVDTAGRVIYMNTFSQTISPALRVGYMVLPPRLLETYRRELGFYACTVPALEQHVLARFLEEGTYERHLSRMRKEYRTRRAAVLDAFRRCAFAGRVRVVEQGAGLHFLLRLDTAETDEALLQRGEELGVRLRFLSQFAALPREEFAHTLVVNYAPLPPHRLPEAMDLLEQALFPPNTGIEP